MKREEVANIWKDIPVRTAPHSVVHRNYDVKLTLNKSGNNRWAVRFGFINYAAEQFEDWEYIEVSDVEKMQNRIYFRPHNAKDNANVYKLSTCRFGDKYAKGRYTTMTPSEKAEKIYRLKWIGKELPIKFDGECELYYIELEPEQ